MPVHIDFETFSEADLPSVGALRYAEDASTEALILGFRIDRSAPVIGVDLTKKGYERKLEPLFNAIQAGEKVIAHNSQFERAVWEKSKTCRHWPRVKPGQWDCTSARASALSLPSSLALSSYSLGLPVSKDTNGKALIMKFSKPQRDGSRIRSGDDPEAFTQFIQYCEQDVVVEEALDDVLPMLNGRERRIFQLDYKINNAGIPLDIALIRKAIEFVQETSRELNRAARKITGGINPTQRDKLLSWLDENGAPLDTLQAAEVERAIANPRTPENVRKLLAMRIEASRAGVKKLQTMLNCASADGRVRGAFWYHSASTGRWGSQRVQFHNLAKPDPAYPQDEVLDLLERDGLDLMYDRPLTAVSKSIRGFIRAPEGRKLLIADYSAVEAVALAWLAGEEWLVTLFRKKGDAYKAMASNIFGIPVSEIDDSQRFFGKQTVLGAGYSMWVPKFMMTCAKFGVKVSEELATKAITGYRTSVPNIVRCWKLVENAALQAVLTGRLVKLYDGRLLFQVETLSNGFDVLFITLPSGRRLAYPQPRVENKEKWGKMVPTLIFKTMYRSLWVDEETYGGKLVENIIQGMCRDMLAQGMLNADAEGLDVVLHVHDEVGSEIDEGAYGVEEFEALVCKQPGWAKGLPLSAKGQVLDRYAK